MIIPPSTYYEMYVKGKDEEELLEVIYEIKKEIVRLKNAIENPDTNMMEFSHPTDSVKLKSHREYLELAKQELADIGGI